MLNEMRIAILVAEGFEQVELTEPRKALDEAGAKTLIVSPAQDQVQGWNHFDKADLVVSLDSDFLSGGPAAVRYSKDFATRRRVTDDRKEMHRFYAVESTPTLTGAKADHRLALAAAEPQDECRHRRDPNRKQGRD